MDNARQLVLEAQAKLMAAKAVLDGLAASRAIDRAELVNQLDFTAELATQLSTIVDGNAPDPVFWDSLATS